MLLASLGCWPYLPSRAQTGAGHRLPVENSLTGADDADHDVTTEELPHCDKPLGKVAVEDGDDPTSWREAGLAPPSKLLKLMIMRSGCFVVVDRGYGLNAASREREIGGSLGPQRGSALGSGQIKSADYVLIAESANSAVKAGGLGGALGGLLGNRMAGGLSRKKIEATTILSLTNLRTTETIASEKGYAAKSKLALAGSPPKIAAGAGGGYDDTDVGRVYTLAYAAAFRKLVDSARRDSVRQDPFIAGTPDSPFLPWPPPSPSSLGDVSASFRLTPEFGGIADLIRARLATRGYEKVHHFSVPGGFGITTDVERINADGSAAIKRWHVGKLPTSGGFLQYISDLFSGDEGRFRVFVFLVTNREPLPADYQATQMDLDRWKATGKPFLSRQMSAAKVQPGTRVWLLVYEFQQSKSKGGKLIAPNQDGLPFRSHLGFLGLK